MDDDALAWREDDAEDTIITEVLSTLVSWDPQPAWLDAVEVFIRLHGTEHLILGGNGPPPLCMVDIDVADFFGHNGTGVGPSIGVLGSGICDLRS